MKTVIFLLVLLTASCWPLASFSQPSWKWAKVFEGSGSGQSGTIKTVVDSAGNVYTMGSFFQTLDFDPGPAVFNMTSAGNMDFFISKLDANGDFLWALRIGDTATGEHLSKMLIDNSGFLYIAGTFIGTVDFDPGPGVQQLTSSAGFDFFILKMDLSGNLVWVKSAPTVTAVSVDVQAFTYDSLNAEIYLSGSFDGVADFDPGPATFYMSSIGYQDVFVLKLDTSGNFIWATRFGGQGHDIAYSLVVNPGSIVIAGSFTADCDFEPGPGVTYLYSFGNHDGFVASLSSTNGTYQWAEQLGGPGVDFSGFLSTTSNGDIYVSGTFSDIADFDPGPGVYTLTAAPGVGHIYITKLDAGGSFIWAKGIGGYSGDAVRDMKTDASGNVYFTGGFQDSVDFDPGAGVYNIYSEGIFDSFVAMLDASGNFVWARSIGGIDDDNMNTIFINNENEVFISGTFWSPEITVDTIIFYNPPPLSSDVIIAKLDSTIISGLEESPVSTGFRFKVFPNPVDNFIHLNAVPCEECIIQIFDLYGRNVFEAKKSTPVFRIDTGRFSSGIYFVVVQNQADRFCQRVMISHPD